MGYGLRAGLRFLSRCRWGNPAPASHSAKIRWLVGPRVVRVLDGVWPSGGGNLKPFHCRLLSPPAFTATPSPPLLHRHSLESSLLYCHSSESSLLPSHSSLAKSPRNPVDCPNATTVNACRHGGRPVLGCRHPKRRVRQASSADQTLDHQFGQLLQCRVVSRGPFASSFLIPLDKARACLCF